jgi:hypothetical protein
MSIGSKGGWVLVGPRGGLGGAWVSGTGTTEAWLAPCHARPPRPFRAGWGVQKTRARSQHQKPPMRGKDPPDGWSDRTLGHYESPRGPAVLAEPVPATQAVLTQAVLGEALREGVIRKGDLREGDCRMLQQAVAVEVPGYVEAHRGIGRGPRCGAVRWDGQGAGFGRGRAGAGGRANDFVGWA